MSLSLSPVVDALRTALARLCVESVYTNAHYAHVKLTRYAYAHLRRSHVHVHCGSSSSSSPVSVVAQSGHKSEG